MVSDIEAAYAAGMLDGEGCITLTRNRRARSPSPQVSVASNDREVLEWLRLRWGGSITTKQPRRASHSISFDWKLTDQRALRFLQQVRPFLQIRRKTRRADLLLDGYLACTPRNGRYTAEMAARKEAFVERFFSLP